MYTTDTIFFNFLLSASNEFNFSSSDVIFSVSTFSTGFSLVFNSLCLLIRGVCVGIDLLYDSSKKKIYFEKRKKLNKIFWDFNN